MKLLLYCCKAKPYLYRQDDDIFELSNKIKYEDISDYKKYYGLNNGKIVAECDFEVHKFKTLNKTIEDYEKFNRNDMLYIFERSNLSYTELIDYLGENSKGYAINIKNLHIFDKPYELGEALIYNFNTQYIVEKAPQNMMEVYNRAGECHILISIRPEWLCKILNGEKTIEVRKKVLKECLE